MKVRSSLIKENKMKEKTDLKKLATYLWGLIPYHKMVHNKQVPVQECPDCLSLVRATLELSYQRGREDEAMSSEGYGEGG